MFGSRERVAFAAVALTLALGACGGQEWPKPVSTVGPVSPKVLLASLRTTKALKTARVSLRASVSGFGAASGGITVDGVTDFVTGSGEMTMHYTGAPSTVYSGALYARVVGGVTYMQIPKPLPNNGMWQDFASPNPQGPVELGFSDPTKALAYLKLVANGLRAVGIDDIRGVEATHYKAVVDLGQVLARNSRIAPALKAQLGRLFQTGAPGGFKVAVDVWIDGSGLLRRSDVTMDLSAIARAAGAPAGEAPIVTIDMDLYDYGASVDVKAPPADQTVPYSSVGSSSLGASS